jgi:tripartite-type tricarboxylate transporter receptor subunit TctC
MLGAGPALVQGDISPERRICFLVSFPPGESTDARASAIRPHMNDQLGR